jgi:hypothetical protein
MDDKLDADLEEARELISRLRTEAADLHQLIIHSRA